MDVSRIRYIASRIEKIVYVGLGVFKTQCVYSVRMLWKELIELWILEVDFIGISGCFLFYFETYTLFPFSPDLGCFLQETWSYRQPFILIPSFMSLRERNIFKFGFSFYKFIKRFWDFTWAKNEKMLQKKTHTLLPR